MHFTEKYSNNYEYYKKGSCEVSEMAYRYKICLPFLLKHKQAVQIMGPADSTKRYQRLGSRKLAHFSAKVIFLNVLGILSTHTTVVVYVGKYRDLLII